MKYRLYKKWICKSEAENFNNICLIVISTGNVIVYSTEKKKKKQQLTGKFSIIARLKQNQLILEVIS